MKDFEFHQIYEAFKKGDYEFPKICKVFTKEDIEFNQKMGE